MNKERIKGMVIGCILCAMISASVLVVAANSTTLSKQITYGINVVFNGKQLEFTEDMRPFTMDGRTFLSLRAMGEILGYPVDYDSTTNTAYVGDKKNIGKKISLRQGAPFYDRAPNNDLCIAFNDTNVMGGVTYNNTLAFATRAYDSAGTNFSLHNLNGQYKILSGYLGRVDGSAMSNVTVNFIGDGKTLQSYDLNATDMPIPINVFVEDVHQLRIEVVFPKTSHTRIWYAFEGCLE